MVLKPCFSPYENNTDRLCLRTKKLRRKTFVHKTEEARRWWRKLHNDELHNLYSSSNYSDHINKNEVGRACSTHESEENAYKILV
jgi:cytoplasmic iron level regulating protein YaaA (DUF328/UPF0246 family)